MKTSLRNPLISVIMPVKDEELFISQCIESIINQTYTHWELIVVDDHSTDRTPAIIHQLALIDHRIKAHTNQGHGIIRALQTGYRESSGQYITRMDGDDLMDPQKLMLMIHALSGQGDEIAVGFVKYFSQTQLGDGYEKYAAWLNHLTQNQNNFQDIYKECTIPSACWMTDRNTFERAGGFDSEVYPEDYDLAFRFRKLNVKLCPVDKPIHLWRDHATRTSRTSSVYADNKFTSLKVHYFLDQDYDSECHLVLWGAGKKGKAIANELLKKDINFSWVTNNSKKIGHHIYGVLITDINKHDFSRSSQIIISISSPKDLPELAAFKNNHSQHTYYHFT